MVDKRLSVKAHFLALRKAIIVSCAAVFIAFVVIYGLFREPVMQLLIGPIKEMGIDLVFTSVSEAFLAYLKVSLWAGLILAMPIVFWQILAFAWPGLYKQEKKKILIVLFLGTSLFVVGIMFAYFVVFKFALMALLFEFSGDFATFITIESYLNFTLKFIFPFGLIFEMPIMVYLLSSTGLITGNKMRQARRYMIVGIFIIAAILTPPDVVSQVMLAVPMLVLYEISILIACYVGRKEKAPNI